MIPERHLHAIELLPDLQHLDLFVPSDGTWSESTLEPLKHMRALTSLSLKIENMSGPLLVSQSLAELTQLQHLHLRCQSDDYLSDQAHLMQTVSKLTGLRTLVLDSMVESSPAELVGLGRLTYLELNTLDLEDPIFNVPPSFSLCTGLRHICLSYLADASDEVWRQICRSIVPLPHLDVLEVKCTDLSRVQPSSWALPRGLTSLTLDDCRMSMIPAAICCLPLLDHLSMVDLDHVGQLENLPRGAILTQSVVVGYQWTQVWGRTGGSGRCSAPPHFHGQIQPKLGSALGKECASALGT